MASVTKLENFVYEGECFDFLYVISDEEGSLPLFPFCFSLFLSKFGVVFESKDISHNFSSGPVKSKVLIDSGVSNLTIQNYVHCLAAFLGYLDECQINHQTPGMHSSPMVSEKFVNNYLNIELPKKLDSHNSLINHQSALSAYFGWLDYMDIKPSLNLRLLRKTKQLMAERCEKEHYIQYVSTKKRFNLLNVCETLGEKLILKMGYKVGLRTSELTGLLLNGKGNLLELFGMLSNPDFDSYGYFKYTLHGRYTKGGRSRELYFDRELLHEMYRYFETERQWLVDSVKGKQNAFFLRSDNRFRGTPIGKRHASNVFRRRAREAGLNPLLSFHDLRHTFATELYHEELSRGDGRETRSESAALIVVAQRLGHQFTKSGHAPPTTTRYIRMRIQMMGVEPE